MIFTYPDIDHIFDTGSDQINSLIIENQVLFSTLLRDLYHQSQGLDGRSVLSDKHKILPLDKNCEILDRFIPFEINQKGILNKLYALIECLSEDDIFYHDTVQIKGEIEAYLNRLSLHYPYEIDFQSVNIVSLLKASNVRFSEEYSCLSEKILDYFTIVRDLDKNKLFITVNLRNYLSDKEMEPFCSELLSRKYDVIMIESIERKRLSSEKRYIVDESLCEIS